MLSAQDGQTIGRHKAAIRTRQWTRDYPPGASQCYKGSCHPPQRRGSNPRPQWWYGSRAGCDKSATLPRLLALMLLLRGMAQSWYVHRMHERRAGVRRFSEISQTVLCVYLCVIYCQSPLTRLLHFLLSFLNFSTIFIRQPFQKYILAITSNHAIIYYLTWKWLTLQRRTTMNKIYQAFQFQINLLRLNLKLRKLERCQSPNAAGPFFCRKTWKDPESSLLLSFYTRIIEGKIDIQH